ATAGNGCKRAVWRCGAFITSISPKRGRTRRQIKRFLLRPVFLGFVPLDAVGIFLLTLVVRCKPSIRGEVIQVSAGDGVPVPVWKCLQDFPLRTTCIHHLTQPLEFCLRPVLAE